jgi:hypothetical protein
MRTAAEAAVHCRVSKVRSPDQQHRGQNPNEHKARLESTDMT